MSMNLHPIKPQASDSTCDVCGQNVSDVFPVGVLGDVKVHSLNGSSCQTTAGGEALLMERIWSLQEKRGGKNKLQHHLRIIL